MLLKISSPPTSFVFVQNSGLLSVVSGFFGIIENVFVSLLGLEKGIRLYVFFSAFFIALFFFKLVWV
jgi:hypothetical protein